MIIGLAARFACNICCFLYPAYASYKALSSPVSDPQGDAQIERWLMYWAVVGTWTAAEAVAGWLFIWLPFYSLFKFLIFLYLSLPQSEGSSYIYRSLLAPFFYEHEADIDHFLSSLRNRATEMLTNGVGIVWERVRQQLNIAGAGYPSVREGHDQVAAPQAPPPSFQDPASGAVRQMYGLMSRYAAQYLPSALAVVQAATSAAGSRSLPPGVAHQQAQLIQETLNMPTPQPTPSPSGEFRPSRTFQHATQEQAGAETSARRIYRTEQHLHPRSVSNPSAQPHMTQRNSDESIKAPSSRSSRSSMGGTGASGWFGEMSSFETIQREDVPDVQSDAATTRPKDARRTSWFGWGGQGAAMADDKRGKAE